MISSYVYYILIAVFGLAVGSFLNVFVLRFEELETIWISRSKCPKCKKVLQWPDLVPFFSYIFLRARCRYCKKPISYQYPIVEGLTALLFVLDYWKFGLSWEALIIAVIIALAISVATYDLLHYEIPDILSYIGIFFALSLIFYRLYLSGEVGNLTAYINYGYSVAIAAGFLGLLVIVSREKWMGKGDILLGVLMGLLLPFPQILVGLFFAFIIGSIAGLILIGVNSKTMKDAIPFGPFLLTGALIGLFWGQNLVDFYLKYLGII